MPARLCASSAVRPACRTPARLRHGLVEVVRILGIVWVVEHRMHAEHNVRAGALALRGARLCAVHNVGLHGTCASVVRTRKAQEKGKGDPGQLTVRLYEAAR